MSSETVILPLSEWDTQDVYTPFTLPDPLPPLPPSPLLLSKIEEGELIAEPYEILDVYASKVCYTSCGHIAEFNTIMSDFDKNAKCKTCNTQYEWVTRMYKNTPNRDTFLLKENSL